MAQIWIILIQPHISQCSWWIYGEEKYFVSWHCLTSRIKLFSITLITPPPVLQAVPNLFLHLFSLLDLRQMLGGGRIPHLTQCPAKTLKSRSFLQKVRSPFPKQSKTKYSKEKVSRTQSSAKFTEISAFPVQLKWSLISGNISQLLFPPAQIRK